GHPEFLGTFAADEIHLVKPTEKRFCFILNTDPRGAPGEHWVAVFIDCRPHGSHSVEYYDPLADPIPKAWFGDLKSLIKRVHHADTYLRFKTNAIADQSNTSSNCGEFSCHFSLARLKGETFGRASGWDARGEHNIEIWKKATMKRWISGGQQGEGLRDIYDYVRKGATRIYQRIKDTLGGPRGGPSPAVRGWLEKYGDMPIVSITVCKKPIFSWIEQIGNWVTQGKLRENMDRLGYEKLMHLYMIVVIKTPDGNLPVKIEKNQIVEIKQGSDVGKAYIPVPSVHGTVNKHFEQAQQAHGEQLWQYHLVTQNCQKFVLWFLGGDVTPEVRQFVEQDIEATLKDMGLLQRIATGITD
ncbi:MAG: hypothetical protein P4L87_15745, partial [Formivibrio sp.]|nr:hypothetical protein [Formivibrio sp.]